MDEHVESITFLREDLKRLESELHNPHSEMSRIELLFNISEDRRLIQEYSNK